MELNEESKSDWSKTFDNIKNLHDAAYKSIEAAITLEESEKLSEAHDKYWHGLTLIDQALNIRVSCSDQTDDTWDEACKLINNLKITKPQISSKVNHLSTVLCQADLLEYIARITPTTYAELALALRALKLKNISSGDEFFIIYKNRAKLYYISPDGTVVTSFCGSELRIFGANGDLPNTFLQVDEWMYPLIPGVSPCYKTDSNGFIFPDIHSDVQGSSVGVIVPEKDNELLYEILTGILYGAIQHESRPSVSTSQWPLAVKDEHLAQEYRFGPTTKGSDFYYSKEEFTAFMSPDENFPLRHLYSAPDDIMSRNRRFAKYLTDEVALITDDVADSISSAAPKLGRFLAPHVQTQGTRLLERISYFREKDSLLSDVPSEGVFTLASGSIEVISAIYHGLQKSASILGQHLRDDTVDPIGPKFGSAEAQLVLDAISRSFDVVDETGEPFRAMTLRSLIMQLPIGTEELHTGDYKLD